MLTKKMFRAEILGTVPNGLTENDVFAIVGSAMRESHKVQSVTKRRLSGGMVSIVVVFEAYDSVLAGASLQYARNSVGGFSADIIGPREVR